MMKYADKIMTEGSKPPHMALILKRVSLKCIPEEWEYIAKEPDYDKIESQCIASVIVREQQGWELRFSSVIFNELGHQDYYPACKTDGAGDST